MNEADPSVVSAVDRGTASLPGPVHPGLATTNVVTITDADDTAGPADDDLRYLVAVGSSAGGLEALQQLMRAVSPTLPVAYVLAQHLSPQYKSLMPELLARETSLTVLPAIDSTVIEPRTVYVAPPNCDVRVDGRVLHVVPPHGGPGPKPSVDALFRSVATTWGEHGVAIVLSGTGSDGASGLRSVKAAGGVAVAQRPETAKYDSMPRAAAATGSVDVVLDTEEIGALLARLCGDGPVAATQAATRVDTLGGILRATQAASGIDFSGYKRSTLLRQCARRQAALQIDDIGDYYTALAADPAEARTLAGNLLVSVTSFFRDPDVWDALGENLPALLADLPDDQQLRVWIPGCATGEEAYTVAMVISEALGRPADLARRVKIFATDLDERALEVARRGEYGEDATESIPYDLRARYSRPTPSGREMLTTVRDCIVFARHNVLTDPPFLRLNLISCRNTLIYFVPRWQDRVIGLFHYALETRGLLVLGGSEGLGPMQSYFNPADAKSRVFRRLVGPSNGEALTGGPRTLTPLGRRDGSDDIRRAPDERAAMRDSLIRAFAPASLVIDEGDSVVEVLGDVAPYCRVPDGRLTTQAAALVQDELAPVLRGLLLSLRHGAGVVTPRLVSTASGSVRMSGRVVRANGAELAVVSFEQVVPSEPSAAGLPVTAAGLDVPEELAVELQRLQQDLDASNTALQATVQELETSNEELQAMNEELQASTEELQASNEELETTNEELQATNEELSTLNQELQVRTNELGMANTDLENIQSSLNQGMILVDASLRVTRFTPLAVRLFALIDDDLGRPLYAIPTTLPIPELRDRLERVIETGSGEIFEVADDRVDYLIGIQTHSATPSDATGAIVSITDVTEMASMRRAVETSLQEFADVTDALQGMVWRRDPHGELTYVNRRVEELARLDRGAVMSDPSLLDSIIDHQDTAAVVAARASSDDTWDVDYRVRRADGALRWWHESASRIRDSAGEPQYIVGSVLDVTDRLRAESEAADLSMIFKSVFDNEFFGVAVVDRTGAISMVNPAFAAIVGRTVAALQGASLSSLSHPTDGPHDDAWLQEVLSGTTEGGMQERRVLDSGGTSHWITLDVRRLPSLQTTDAAAIAVAHDVTGLRQAHARLTRQARFDAQTGLANRAYFRERLSQELTRCERNEEVCAVIWIDLDGFKEVNDQHGHQAGDAVLHEVAGRIRGVTRKQDLVGRLGGDEFAVLLTTVSGVDALEQTAERILNALRRPMNVGDTALYISGSLGIAMFPEDGDEPDALLHHADTAMYEAKREGRDRHVYFLSEMNEIAEERASMRQELAQALRAQEFLMHYQPVVSLADSTIVSFESLVRWNRAGSPVSAAHFIDLAEQTGQIRQLGRLVLDRVAADARYLDLQHQGPLVPIAVNFSPSQLEEHAFLDVLLSWEPPGGWGRMVIEVTESVLLDVPGRGREALVLLRKLGATLCVDDFGKGYSNLSLLDSLAPGIIKIDRSFIDRAVDDQRSRSLLRAATTMGNALEAVVIAEGVSSQAHLDVARGAGITLGQGYLLAHPAAIKDAVVLLERQGRSSLDAVAPVVTLS